MDRAQRPFHGHQIEECLMPNQDRRVPGSDHPFTIEPNGKRVTVSLGGKTIVDTTNALILREAAYAPVQYIPRADVDFAYLSGSDHRTHCPYKGDASYFDGSADDRRMENIAWSYEEPFDAVAAIRGHIAFYPGRVDMPQE
ncbi:DUF427 domain-containing protein [Sphingomonas morindae]|uniref:DUF427 domain-containing protein n=1 Tax=Sphingomonas morindae TaxID=1541170 RepID=A0ABY4XAH7_9SPHN|nr:DUF427 domain-containing protein [Sphingomonas morindae]USI73904.1 DUF427 domain-containing protein [Sphingomonas morindae]